MHMCSISIRHSAADADISAFQNILLWHKTQKVSIKKLLRYQDVEILEASLLLCNKASEAVELTK